MGIVRLGKALFLQSHGGWKGNWQMTTFEPWNPVSQKRTPGPERRSGWPTVLVFTASPGDRAAGVSCRAHSGSQKVGVWEECRLLGQEIGEAGGQGVEASVGRVSWTIQGVGTLWKHKQTVAGVDRVSSVCSSKLHWGACPSLLVHATLPETLSGD